MRRPPLLALAAWLALAAAAPAAGLPVLGEAERLAGLRLFPDHEDGSLWWYLPARLELVEGEDGPSFRFERYRYTGAAATGDRGVTWGKGIVSLRVRLAADPASLAAAEAAVESRLRRPIALRAVPLRRIDSVLLYAATGAAGERADGELADGEWRDEPGRWTDRTFLVAMEPRTTELLWDAFHGDGLAMSLGYSLVGTAVSHRPAADPFGGEPEAVTPGELTLGGDALAIRVSPAACPGCFVSTELDAEIPAEYPFLDTRCYDFANGRSPGDLGLVVVEVRATAVNGDPLVERVRFAPAGPTTAAVHFALAVSLDAGYSYRVARVYGDGRTELGDWRRETTWSGLLDVTEDRRPTDRGLDPRALY